MTNESREQILADFIECTGLEDMNECITFLDQYQWNLLNAVQAVHEQFGGGSAASGNDSTVPKSSSTVKKSSQTTKARRTTDSDGDDNSSDLKVIKSIPGNARAPRGAVGGATRGTGRELHFTVEYKDHTQRITMSDNETIHDLQSKIADKLHVPANRQKFTNWLSKTYNDHTVLKDLHLPKENEIHLISTATSTVNGASRSSTSTSTTNHTHRHSTSPTKHTSTSYYPITVLCEDKNGKLTPFELVLKPNSKISDLKKEIELAAHIPIRQQSWHGLMDAKDSDELSRTNIQRKAHLQVKRIDSSVNQRDTKNSTVHRHRSEDEPMDVDNYVDFEQYEGDTHSVYPLGSNETTTVASSSSSRELLIPDRCTDDIAALENFSRVFHYRFGSTGPILYIGSLEQAIQDSIFAPRIERRPLAIYIHNDRSVCANVFCTQVLASETTIEYLANNYVVWAWDISTDANRARLFELFKRHLGHQNAQRISIMEKDAFPLLLVLSRARGSIELINIIEGKSTPSEVLLNLIQAHESFEQQRQRDAEEEIQREKREDLKKQQEDEYHRSLQADLAKEQARLDQERKQKEEETLNQRKIQKQLKDQQDCLARLTEEPNETEKNITRFKIRLPDDEGILMRRFRISDQLQTLFDYLTSQGKVFGEYKLLTTYPKRDLTTLSRSDTFEQLKLFPQEQLILESL